MTKLRWERILIVDDVAANLEILANILAPLYSVQVAKSGKGALEIAQTPPVLLKGKTFRVKVFRIKT